MSCTRSERTNLLAHILSDASACTTSVAPNLAEVSTATPPEVALSADPVEAAHEKVDVKPALNAHDRGPSCWAW
eukprot:6770623-Pyramimonas_sp.AAC.1